MESDPGSSSQTDDRAKLGSAYKAFLDGRYPEALEALLSLSKDGVPEAGLYLGCMYRDRLRVEKNSGTAINYFEASIASGSDVAALYAARLAEKTGAFEEAARFFKIAADTGNVSAAYAMYRLSKDHKIKLSSLEQEAFLDQAYLGGHVYANRDRLRSMMHGKHGFVSRLLSLPLTGIGVVKMAFLLANDPSSDRLH